MATTRTPAPRKRKPAPKSKTTTSASSAAARKRKPPARGAAKSAARTRAKRSSATWAPRVPVIEQRHLDLFGLALVACGVFLVFPLYLGWDGGQAGDGVVDGLALAVGQLRYVAPVGVLAVGAVIVMRPVLPSVRPFKSGGICFVLALALMFAAGTLGLGPDTVRDGYWNADFLRDRGGYLGEGLFYVSSNLIGSIGTHILALFLFLAGVLLLTGASVAGVLKATGGTVAESTRVLRSATATARPTEATSGRGAAATAAGATKGGRPRVRVPETADDDLVVKATHVEAPSLDGVERYPDLFGDDEPAGALPDEEPRIRRRKKAAEPLDAIPEPEDDDLTVERTPQSAAEDANDAAVEDAVMATDDLPELTQDFDPDDDGEPKQLELPAARGRGRSRGHRVRRPGRAGPQALHRRPDPPRHQRQREDRRVAGRGAEPLQRGGQGRRHRQRPAHHALRAAPRARREDEQGRPAQGRPGLRAGRDRDPHPRADPGQAGRRHRGPQPRPHAPSTSATSSARAPRATRR